MTYIPEEKEFEEGGVTYRIVKLLASDHFDLLEEVGTFAGSALNGVGIDNDINVGMVISGLFNNSYGVKASVFMKKWIKKCVVQPNMEKDNYETHFGEHFHNIIGVFENILNQQFSKSAVELKKKLSQSEKFTLIMSLILSRQSQSTMPESDSEQLTSDSASTKA